MMRARVSEHSISRLADIPSAAYSSVFSSAPEILQKKNVQIFGKFSGVHIVFDDLTIVAENEQEHNRILRAVLKRVRQHCVCFNLDKLPLKISKVNYVGHVLSDGMSPGTEKVSAVINMQPSKDAWISIVLLAWPITRLRMYQTSPA